MALHIAWLGKLSRLSQISELQSKHHRFTDRHDFFSALYRNTTERGRNALVRDEISQAIQAGVKDASLGNPPCQKPPLT